MISLGEREPRRLLERDRARAIRVALNRLPGVRCSQNVVGVLRGENDVKRRVGLGVGSPDIVGVVTLFAGIMPVAVAFGIEVKQPGKYATRKQRAWHLVAEGRGMRTYVARTAEEAVAQIQVLRQALITIGGLRER